MRLLPFAFAAAAWAQQAQAPQTFWMRAYPMREFGFFWSVDLAVADGPKARERILSTLEKAGGKLTHSLEAFPADTGLKHQQFSYVVPKAGAEKALRQLRRLGTVRRLAQNVEGSADFSVEARAKLKALDEERTMGKAQLAQLPSTRAAVDEIVANLKAALDARERSADRVLFNIAVEEVPAAKK